MMTIILLYRLLLKSTLRSFSGPASLPMVRHDFGERYRVLTDRQLTAAVAAGQMGPGPMGLYVVSVGYSVAGIPGACAGWLAMITPAFLVIPVLRFIGKRAEHARAKSVTRAVLLAGAGLLLSASVPLAQDAIHRPISIGIAVLSFALIAFTRIDTSW